MMRCPFAIVARSRRLARVLFASSANGGRARCGAFTLVELLVVISIITLLASIVLVAMAGVQETARADRTRSQIARIDALLSERWEAYRSRRVPLPPARKYAARFDRVEKMRLDKDRVDMLREMMRMELPDRKTDLLTGPRILSAAPALWHAYRRQAATLINQRRSDVSFPITDNSIDKELDAHWTTQFQQAECLYLILSQIMDQEAKALEFFSANEIGDTDNDGMPELLDGWGRPIIFLRWAPGLQIAGSPQDGESPDPFDMLGVYPRFFQVRTFALYPLIASFGPDGQLDIVTDRTTDDRGRINYANEDPSNNPFVVFPVGPVPGAVGTPSDINGDGILGWLDNITNHNLTGS